MSQFNTLNYYPILFNLYVNVYVTSTQLGILLLFYPVGIVLTIYLIVCVFYIIFKWVNDLRKVVRQCSYYFFELFLFLENLISWLPYVYSPIIHIYNLLRNTVLCYSIYILVFYLKRAEFYVFCFFVIAYYY